MPTSADPAPALPTRSVPALTLETGAKLQPANQVLGGHRCASLKFAAAASCRRAVLAAGAAQAADPVKIRVSYVIAPSDWAPLLPEKPDLLKHNGKSYQLEVVRVVGTPALVQAMANNEIEIGNHSYSSLGIAIQNAGMDDLRVISDQFQDGVPGKFDDAISTCSRTARSRRSKTSRARSCPATPRAPRSTSRCARCCSKHGLEDKRDYTHHRSAAAGAEGDAARQEDRPDPERGAVPVRSGAPGQGPRAVHPARRVRHHADDRVDRAQELHRQEPRRDGRFHGGRAARGALVSRPGEPRRSGARSRPSSPSIPPERFPAGCSPSRTTPATAT